MSNSLLELLNEVVLLTKELVENETMSQTEKAEMLRGIASKIYSAISYSLENISTFISRVAYQPIYLMRLSPLLSSEATRKYLNIDRAEWEKLIEERGKLEYGEKGILLYNGLEQSLRGQYSTIEELLEQTSKRKYGSRLGEIWLLRTGRFLELKTTHYEVKGKQRILIDKPDIEYAYIWKGEARETVDPSELTRDEILETTLRVTHTITKILSHLEKIDKNQQEALFTVLSNMLWYRDNLYRKDEIVRDRILYNHLLYRTYLGPYRPGPEPFYILKHGWDQMQSVMDEHIKWLSPKTISNHAETELAQKAIAHVLYVEAHNQQLEYPFREYIEKLGKDAVEHLVKGLKLQGLGRENERRTAAKWLAVIGDKEALEPLIEALNDEDERVVLYAAEALVKMGEGERAIEPLQRAFERYRFVLDWKDGRKQLADALARAYAVMLEEALKVHDYEKARKAKTGLEKIGKLAT